MLSKLLVVGRLVVSTMLLVFRGAQQQVQHVLHSTYKALTLLETEDEERGKLR